MCRLLIGIMAAILAASIEAVSAEDYPTRAITLVVPFPAGGGVDTVARIVGEKLSVALKQRIVIDNRPSGGAILGARVVAKAAPDGYTLLLGHTGTLSINPSLYANVGYDPRTDFGPIGLIATIPIGLVVHPSVPAKSVADLIALARREPGRLTIGTSVIGSGGYMAAELFKDAARLDMTIVPYKGPSNAHGCPSASRETPVKPTHLARCRPSASTLVLGSQSGDSGIEVTPATGGTGAKSALGTRSGYGFRGCN